MKQTQEEMRELDIDGKKILVPVTWSDTAARIVRKHYMTRDEIDVRDMIHRVLREINTVLKDDGWYEGMYDDLINQRVSFNSPVWYNVGVNPKPQISACFILSVDDSMDSIMEWWTNEAKVFRGGSGAGINLSNLRGSNESISGRGTSSGPLSFMQAADSIAGSIKSGGKTRRAAKMVILNADHPDIEEFIESKAKEEDKSRVLKQAGFNTSINGEAYRNLLYQNANHSVRVSDDFMVAVDEDREWDLTSRKTGEVVKTVKARDLFRKIAQAAWRSGDPGIQFDDTINEWNTLPSIGRINGSNPCSEYMHLDNTSCNLASINLLKYFIPGYKTYDDSFAWDRFLKTVHRTIMAMDALITIAGYPTKELEENTKKYRELGIGYANAGALIMAMGMAYDSEEAHLLMADITAAMTLKGYEVSNALGILYGEELSESALTEVNKIHWRHWDMASNFIRRTLGENAEPSEPNKCSYRNSQISVIAPTGTISFMMDCDTTGIEPIFALTTVKEFVGGGYLTMVPNVIKYALQTYVKDDLGNPLSPDTIKTILEELQQGKDLRLPSEKYLSLFATAQGGQGVPAIDPMGHVNMMEAIQPFLSGAISKTVNMPNSATVGDIENIYMKAWERGLKAIAIYRDGSKETQVLTSVSKTEVDAESTVNVPTMWIPNDPESHRKRLPVERPSLTHRFEIGGHEGYITVGMYADGSPGEVFITMSKEGSTLSGIMDAFATSVSIALQYGVPLENLVRKFTGTRFEPSGFTLNPEIRNVSSVLDYIFRWLELKFNGESSNGRTTDFDSENEGSIPSSPATTISVHCPKHGMVDLDHKCSARNKMVKDNIAPDIQFYEPRYIHYNGDLCQECGGLMQRTGSCMTCTVCAISTGGC